MSRQSSLRELLLAVCSAACMLSTCLSSGRSTSHCSCPCVLPALFGLAAGASYSGPTRELYPWRCGLVLLQRANVMLMRLGRRSLLGPFSLLELRGLPVLFKPSCNLQCWRCDCMLGCAMGRPSGLVRLGRLFSVAQQLCKLGAQRSGGLGMAAPAVRAPLELLNGAPAQAPSPQSPSDINS